MVLGRSHGCVMLHRLVLVAYPLVGILACAPSDAAAPTPAASEVSADLTGHDGDEPLPDGNVSAGPRPQRAEPETDGPESCPAGLGVRLGTDGPDVRIAAPDECHVLLAGNDVLLDLVGGNGAVLAGAGDDAVQVTGPALIALGTGDDTLNASGAGLQLYGQDGDDTMNASSASGALIDAGPGRDLLQSIAGPSVRVFSRGGDDVVNVTSNDGVVHAGFGDDTLNVIGDRSATTPGPGRDVVNVTRSEAVVLINDTCEVVDGEIYNASGSGTRLVSPVPASELDAMGVTVNGFSAIEVVPGRSHLSECSCFHGVPQTITDDAVTCLCDAGWTGERCDICASLTDCAPEADVIALRDRILDITQPAASVSSTAELLASHLAWDILAADLTVVGRIVAGWDFVVEGAGTTVVHSEVVLDVDEVLRGPSVARTTFRYLGHFEPLPGSSAAPEYSTGEPFLWAVRFSASGNALVRKGTSWRVTSAGTIRSGPLEISIDDLAAAVAEVEGG